MITLGVTGGLGSGKSTVCTMFTDLGVPVFLADEEAKRLMVEHPQLRASLIDAFGAGTYTSSGELDRQYLAERVFNDPDQLARINAIVHPRVFEEFEAFRSMADQRGAQLAIKEAAVLFESGGDRHVDRTLVVDAPIATRIRRVSERDGMSRQEALRRMRCDRSSMLS
jgi:dephospho-CoA kinase